jgi:hypothetical protein
MTHPATFRKGAGADFDDVVDLGVRWIGRHQARRLPPPRRKEKMVDRECAVLRSMRRLGGKDIESKEIARNLGYTYSMVFRRLKILQNAGKIDTSGHGAAARWWIVGVE